MWPQYLIYTLCLFPHRTDVKTKWGNTRTTLEAGAGSYYYHMKKLQSCAWVQAHILPNDSITRDPWITLPCSNSYACAYTDRENNSEPIVGQAPLQSRMVPSRAGCFPKIRHRHTSLREHSVLLPLRNVESININKDDYKFCIFMGDSRHLPQQPSEANSPDY